jgi:hypothetical protein
VNKGSGSSPIDDNLVICAISWVSIDTGLSNQRKPPWMKLNSNLMHMLIFVLLPKSGISNKFNMHVRCNHVSHSCDLTAISSEFRLSPMCRYFCGANSGNFFRSTRLWSENHRLHTTPNMSP